MRMGRVLHELEKHDRWLQAAVPDPLLGTASLHASVIEGGREMSSYPDRCVLRLERRTVGMESEEIVTTELERLLARLGEADPEFEGSLRPVLARPSYQVSPDHDLPIALRTALASSGDAARGSREFVGMTFWTDAA